jgi:unspecific monooxygenase
MAEAQSASFPPTPAAASSRGVARLLRDNALGIFPPEAFTAEIVHRRFFGRRQIILSRPAAIQHILIDNWANYRRTAATGRMLRPLLGEGLLLSQGEDWQRQRRIVAPALAPRMMPIMARHIARAAQAAIARLAAADGAGVNLLAEMQSLALEIAAAAMFSLDMTRSGAELREMIVGYALRLGRPTLLDFLLPASIPSPRDLMRRRFRRRWLALIARLVAERRAQVPAAPIPDLFDLLAEGAPSAKQLHDEVATLLLAGHETTAVGLFWTLFLVATNPAAQQRLAEEAAALDLGPAAAAAAVPRLVHARAVVHEALRLYPPAFTLARQARADDVAGGVPVQAGAVVLIAPWVLHRHRKLWPRPEVFDPARFLPGAAPPERFAYLPFGIGPRICVGAQLALTEATLVLASLVQAFHIDRASAEPVTPAAIVTTQPDHPPLFRLRRRKSGIDEPSAAIG